MSSSPPPTQIPQLQFAISPLSPAPSYTDFIKELRARTQRLRANDTIGVLVTVGAVTVVMSLAQNLWCNQFGFLAAKNQMQWAAVPSNMENYPTSVDFPINAKAWRNSVDTLAKWVTGGGKGVRLTSEFYVMIFFVSEAARLEPVRLQSSLLQASVEALVSWQTVLPLLQNWEKICAGPPRLGVSTQACLTYGENNGFQKPTMAWLNAMAAFEAGGG